MKKFEVSADINGTIIFEVKAKNQKEAQKQVDDLLGETSVKDALKQYRNNVTLLMKAKEIKERSER